jgi:excisionase family DNA binding protein
MACTPTEPQAVYTVAEVAKLLRISRRHTYELIARGVLPSVSLGRVLRVPAPAVEQLLRGEEKHRGETSR